MQEGPALNPADCSATLEGVIDLSQHAPHTTVMVDGFVRLSRQNQHTLAWLATAAASAPPGLRSALEELLALERQQEALIHQAMASHFGLRLVSCCPTPTATPVATSEVIQ
jgi:hypothetical protein